MKQRSLAPVLLLLVATGVAAESEQPQEPTINSWQIYSRLDTFAFSEPVSIDSFVNDFDDSLQSGDTAFTHDEVELGVRWRNYRIGVVKRFDYITEFTEDTALFHHSEKNRYPLNVNRDYHLELSAEKIVADGIKFGYNRDIGQAFNIDVAFTYYHRTTQLISGSVSSFGSPESINSQLQQLSADAQAIIDGLGNSTDLSPLYALIEDVETIIAIDYAYADPKFKEPDYRKPVIVGDPSPPLSGVSFRDPEGTGYSLDLGFAWQLNERTRLGLKLYDIVNNFEWDNAPTTRVNLDLNALLADTIAVAQDYVNGKIIRPNDLIDKHLLVTIENRNYDQELPWRGDLDISYNLGPRFELWGWSPELHVLGGLYHTEMHSFPRLGVGIGKGLRLHYDFGGEALSIDYRHRFFFVQLIADTFDFEKARTFGLNVGLSFDF